MFCGHGIKSVQHGGIVQQGFSGTDGKRVPFLASISPGDIDG